MYKKEFDNLINNKRFPKSLLLYGNEYYTNHYVKYIMNSLTTQDSVLSFYFDEYDFKSAKNFISQPSLFGDINFLYIKNDKKIPSNELKEFIKICHINSLSYFYYEYLGDDSQAKSMANLFRKDKDAYSVRFFKPTLHEAITLLRRESEKLNIKISNQVLRELYELENENLSLAINDLNKLSLLDKEINSKDIGEYIFGVGEMVIDDFIYKILNKSEFGDDLNHILDSTDLDAVKIINSMQKYITMLLMFNLYIKGHGSYNAKEILGYNLPNHLSAQRAEFSIKIPTKKYEKILKLLIESEFSLKNEKNIDKNSFLYSVLIKLQRLL